MLTEGLTTKDKLIRAARLIGARDGLAAATTAAIAAEAGVAEGTLYRHFASKDDLLIEAYRRLKAEVFARVTDRTPDDGDAEARLKLAWRAIYEAYRSDASGFVFGQRFGESPLADREGGVALEPVGAALGRLHADGLKAGIFKDRPLDLMSNLFLGPLGYMLRAEMKGRAWSAADLEAAAEAVLDSWRRS